MFWVLLITTVRGAFVRCNQNLKSVRLLSINYATRHERSCFNSNRLNDQFVVCCFIQSTKQSHFNQSKLPDRLFMNRITYVYSFQSCSIEVIFRSFLEPCGHSEVILRSWEVAREIMWGRDGDHLVLSRGCQECFGHDFGNLSTS